LSTEEIPERYKTQMLWQMSCTGRDWCDFVSFDPRLPANLQLFIKSFYADKEAIQDLKAEVIKFLVELENMVMRLAERSLSVA
jgi:hypothetical protein